MTRLRINELASEELTDAVRWYEERRPGWGARFFDAVSDALDVIGRHPEIGAPRGAQQFTRQLAVRGFPYLVVYRITSDDVYIVAIAHTSRRPGFWRRRS